MKPKRTSSFVLNHSANQPVPEIQRLVFNLLATKTRTEMLEGVEHTVVPMVMMTEGVHNGSAGPLFYGSEEMSKTPELWDHKPIVVYHPEMDGKAISACQPAIINQRKVGLIMNTKFKDGRLTSEAWINPLRANEVDERVMESVNTGSMMELSTGLFTDLDPTKGKWNEEDFVGTVHNFRADHLALLPDKQGACSINDGAGFIRNTKNPLVKNSKDAPIWKSNGLVNNEMSFDNIRQSLSDAIRSKLNVNNGTPGDIAWVWVADVYSNFVVYEQNQKLFSIGYTANNAVVTLSAETPVEVRRVTEYRKVADAAFVGNQDQQKKKPMDKTKVVNSIVGKKGWSEDDRISLMALNEAALQRIADSVVETPAPAPVAAAVPAVVVPTVNADQASPKAQTLAELLLNADPNLRASITSATNSYVKQKAAVTAAIVANKANTFTPEWLATQELDVLNAIAGLAKATVAPVAPVFYHGMAPIENADQGAMPEPLPLPSTFRERTPATVTK